MNENNMEHIMNIAKKISGEMNIDKENKNIDMGEIIKQVTQSVSKIVTPEFVSKMSGNQDSAIQLKKPVNNVHHHRHKISKSRGKTKDIEYNLDVTLDDLYFGKQKKIGVRVKRMNDEGEYIDEKIKLTVNIKPGMMNEEVITFEGMADHREGFVPGDINITLNLLDNDEFVRNGDDLIYEKTITLAQCYSLNFTFTHIDGNTYKLTGSDNTFNEDVPFRKIVGLGMPIIDSDDGREFGDLIIKLNYELPLTLEEEKIELLHTIFPQEISDVIEDSSILMVESVPVTADEMEELYEDDDDDDDDVDDDDDDVIEEEEEEEDEDN